MSFYSEKVSIVPPHDNPTPKPAIITFMPGLMLWRSMASLNPMKTVEETVFPVSSK